MSKRSDAKKEVEDYKKLLTPYLNTPLVMSFDKHTFPISISDIILAKLTTLENKPDIRQGEEKNYRPPVLTMNTNAGDLHFILEDITITFITEGFRIKTAAVLIEMRKQDYDNKASR